VKLSAAGSVTEVRSSAVRRVGAAVFRAMARQIVPDSTGTQCGFKFFSGPLARAAARPLRTAGFAFGRSTDRMAALIRASVDAGTSRARRSGAWIVAGPDGDVLAERPVHDQLAAAGAAVRRQATPMERLTGASQP
jgi:hypothetical protein